MKLSVVSCQLSVGGRALPRRVFGSAFAAALLGLGCNSQLDLGSDLLWAADHESGDLGQWIEGANGGARLPSADSSIEVSAESAHRGVGRPAWTQHAVAGPASESSGKIVVFVLVAIVTHRGIDQRAQLRAFFRGVVIEKLQLRNYACAHALE